MAKDRTAYQPREIRSKEDRNSGRGSFVTLKKTGESFVGYALFKPDPELADNPGYYEYFEHYTPATGYCPCFGPDDCPICDDGDTPGTRAKSIWLIDDEIKIFNLNWYMIEDFSDYLSEGEPILGQAFRIKRKAGQGRYEIRPKSDVLTKTDLKKALKQIDDDMLRNQAIKKMKQIAEEFEAEGAMTEDDEDDKKDGKATFSKKGKPAKEEPSGEFDHEESDEAEDLTVEVVKLKKKDNVLVVKVGDGDEFEIFGTDELDLTGYSKGDEISVSFEKDSDGDFVVSEVSEGGAGDGDLTSIEGETVTITAVNSEHETLTVKMEDGTEFDLYFLGDGQDDNDRDWGDLDLDDYKEDQEIVITAALDPDGDMVASVFPEPVEKKGGKKAGKSSSKKGGKKSSK